MRNSITLFLTLLFIISAIGIITSILKIYKKSTSYSFEYISQNSKIITNLQKFLKETNQTQKFFNIPITFSSKEGDFKIQIKLTPICTININDYLKKNEINQSIDTLFDFLAYKYQIQDPIFLKDLILDTIDEDKQERSPYTEALEDGKIYNYSHFKKLLNYYAKKTQDKRVFDIPWEEFFNFKKTQLLKECVNKEILDLNEQNKTSFNIITSARFVNIDISYVLKKTHNLKILYDIKQKKAIDIENTPLY